MSLKSRPPLGGKWGHGLTSLSNVTKTSEGAGGHFVDVTHGEEVEAHLEAFVAKRELEGVVSALVNLPGQGEETIVGPVPGEAEGGVDAA